MAEQAPGCNVKLKKSGRSLQILSLCLGKITLTSSFNNSLVSLSLFSPDFIHTLLCVNLKEFRYIGIYGDHTRINTQTRAHNALYPLYFLKKNLGHMFIVRGFT